MNQFNRNIFLIPRLLLVYCLPCARYHAYKWGFGDVRGGLRGWVGHLLRGVSDSHHSPFCPVQTPGHLKREGLALAALGGLLSVGLHCGVCHGAPGTRLNATPRSNLS